VDLDLQVAADDLDVDDDLFVLSSCQSVPVFLLRVQGIAEGNVLSQL
jgi:hypothetical protein